jgi:hypothetical protein
MPYTQRVTWFPATGKDAEMRALIEERVHALQAAGVRSGLQQALYSEDRPAFAYTLSFDDLAALEAHRASGLGVGSPAVQAAFASKILGLARQPTRIELYENALVAQPSATPRRYFQRTIRLPLAGKNLALQNLLVERGKETQAQGFPSGVSVRVAGGPGCVVQIIQLESLAQLEKLRLSNRTDPRMQKFTAQLEALHQGAPTVEVNEVLIPLPPR